MLAGLGACTSMTMRMYAERKSLPLDRVTVTLTHSKIHAEDCAECETKSGMLDQIERVIAMEGDARRRTAQQADGNRRQMPGAPHPHLGGPHRDPRRRLTNSPAGISSALSASWLRRAALPRLTVQTSSRGAQRRLERMKQLKMPRGNAMPSWPASTPRAHLHAGGMEPADVAQFAARDVAGRSCLGHHCRRRRAGDAVAQSR